jgi:hypothetical protein
MVLENSENILIKINNSYYEVNEEEYFSYCKDNAYHYPTVFEWVKLNGKIRDKPETEEDVMNS